MKLIFNKDKTEIAIIKSEVILEIGEHDAKVKNVLRIYVEPKENPDLMMFFDEKVGDISIDNNEIIKTYTGYKTVTVNENMTELSLQIAITMEKEINPNVQCYRKSFSYRK